MRSRVDTGYPGDRRGDCRDHPGDMHVDSCDYPGDRHADRRNCLRGTSVDSCDYLSDVFYEQVREELKGRVDARRYAHSLSVVDTAVDLAELYGVDVCEARLAAILHDWDKGMNDEEMRARIRSFDLDLPRELVAAIPRALHGQTAACEFASRFPDFPPAVLQAIERHTFAAIDMQEIDMLLYVADALEPLRDFEGLAFFREKIGILPLKELFLLCFEDILAGLIRKRKTVNAISIEAWNHYMRKGLT